MRPRRYTERISFTVLLGTKAKLKREAKLLGVSMSELVRDIAERPSDDEVGLVR